MRVLVTGAAGFVGAATAERLLGRGDSVVGFDDLNPYYDVGLKRARLARLRKNGAFEFVRGDIRREAAVEAVFRAHAPERVVHLAAQAGVRHSVAEPRAFVETNVTGFLNVLEAARQTGVGHVLYASSSAVYGSGGRLPHAVGEGTDRPISVYAATKKSNEEMAHVYSHLYGLPTTGLRLFSVYGPWGRPDTALCVFAARMLAGKPLDVFNGGRHTRDFTYIDDVAEVVVRTLDRAPARDPLSERGTRGTGASSAPFRVHNVGSGRPVGIMRCVALLEAELGVRARVRFLPHQPGDVAETCADVASLEAAVGYRPETPIEVGIGRFANWHRSYYGGGKGLAVP